MNRMANAGPRALLFGVGVYLVGINVASVGLFWYDKKQSLAHQWRVPERTLQLTALLGGWPGGMWAMEQFRHKTQKQEFRVPYFLATGVNCAILGAGGFFLYNKGGAGTQAVINDFMSSPLGRTVINEGKKIIRRGGRR